LLLLVNELPLTQRSSTTQWVKYHKLEADGGLELKMIKQWRIYTKACYTYLPFYLWTFLFMCTVCC